MLRGLASKPGFRGGGLLSRFLYLLPQTNLGYRTLETISMPYAIKMAYTDGINSMLNWDSAKYPNGHSCRHVIRLSKGAYKKHHDYAKKIETEMRLDGSMEHVTDWAGKAPGAAVRIAGVLHGIKCPW